MITKISDFRTTEVEACETRRVSQNCELRSQTTQEAGEDEAVAVQLRCGLPEAQVVASETVS